MHLFCPSSSAWQSEGFVNLKGWLAAQGKTHNTIKQIIIYAKRFASVLDTQDASPLLVLSPRNRHHALASLASLSKFQGRYDQFLQLRRRYSLKWSNEGNDSVQTLSRFFNPDLTLDIMIQKVRQMIDVLPPIMGEIIKFGCLVGLRSVEICESVRLINDKDAFAQYYDPVQQALLHYKFKQQFLRTTKKCFISFITLDNLQPIANLGPKTPSWNAIRLTCKRRGVDCNMRYCRKIHASWLRKEGIQPEIIDMLQGSVSQSILTRHYLVPQAKLKDDVLQALEQLQCQL